MSLIDNLDSYSSEVSLNGNGTWLAHSDWQTSSDTPTGFPDTSPNSAQRNTEGSAANNAEATFSEQATGKQRWKWISNGATNEVAVTSMLDGTVYAATIRMNGAGWFQYYNGTEYVNIVEFSANTKYTIEIQWRISDTKVRYLVDATDTGWVTARDDTWTAVDRVRLETGTSQGDIVYWDTFSDPDAVSGPANLKTYNTNTKANIKTINTNAIANVKSLDTNV